MISLIENYPSGYLKSNTSNSIVKETNIENSSSESTPSDSQIGQKVSYRNNAEKQRLRKELLKQGLDIDKRYDKIVPKGYYYTNTGQLRKSGPKYDAELIETANGKEIITYGKVPSKVVKDRIEKYNNSNKVPDTQQPKDVVYDSKGFASSKAYEVQTPEEKERTAKVSETFISSKDNTNRGDNNGSVHDRLYSGGNNSYNSSSIAASVDSKESVSQIPQGTVKRTAEVFGKPTYEEKILGLQSDLELGRRKTFGNENKGLEYAGYTAGAFGLGYVKGFIGIITHPIGFVKSTYQLITKPRQTVDTMSEYAGENPVGFAGEIMGSAKGGEVTFKAIGPTISKTEIPTSTGTVTVKSLAFEPNLPGVKGKSFILGSVIDSPARSGVSTFSGAPKVIEFFKQMPEGKEIRISNPTETKIVFENIRNEPNVVSETRAQQYIPTVQNIIRKTQNTQSSFIKDFSGGTERLSPEGVQIVLGVAKENKGVVSGSFSRSAQLADKYTINSRSSNPGKPVKWKIQEGDYGSVYIEPKMNSGDYVQVYHGTSEQNYANILNEGLKRKPSNFKEGYEEPYISTTLDKGVAKAYAGDSGKVVELNIPKKEFETLWNDKVFQDPYSSTEPNIAFDMEQLPKEWSANPSKPIEFVLNKRPRDIDVHLEGSPEHIQSVAEDTLNRLRNAGFDAKLKGEGGTVKNAIEVKQPGGQYEKAVEFLGEGTIPESEIPPDMVLGFTKEGKKIDIGGVKSTSLAEELRGTAQGTARLRNVDNKLDIYPPEKRVKDIASVSVSARTLYQSQTIKRPGLKKDIETFESLYPEEIVYEQVKEVKVPIADYSLKTSTASSSMSPLAFSSFSMSNEPSVKSISSIPSPSSPSTTSTSSMSPIGSPSNLSPSPSSSPSNIPSVNIRSTIPSVRTPPSSPSTPSSPSISITSTSTSPSPSPKPPSPSPPSVPSTSSIPNNTPSFNFSNDSKKKKSKSKLFVKKKGKFELRGEGEDVGLLFKRGKDIIENTASASFKVVSDSGQAIMPGILGNRFTKSKKNTGVIVQKREYRISTAGEKFEIPGKAQRNKSLRRLI